MKRARLPFLLLVLLAFHSPETLAQGEVTITNGSYAVTVHEQGVLVAVPPQGLATVDGATVELGQGFAEWCGVSFEGPSGRVEAVGSGRTPDWSHRAPLVPVSMIASADACTTVARIGPLDVQTTFLFAPGRPYLVVTVRFTNQGSSALQNLFYSREWLQPDVAGWSFPPDFVEQGIVPWNVCRVLWMWITLAPGETRGATLTFAPADGISVQGTDVPLVKWTHPDFPGGLRLGPTFGVSFGDYNGDGWTDIFAARSSKLVRNLQGTSWRVFSLTSVLPSEFRYGSSIGDYDLDGLGDIATEPRPGTEPCFHLLHNLGGLRNFVDVAVDPAILDVQPCNISSETICWGDTDGDADLDCFLPAYPPQGNFFFQNLGPTGPGGAYRFMEATATAGLRIPPGAVRPEGAAFCDVDSDGDIDLYSNGALYQNRTEVGQAPSFVALDTLASGIGNRDVLDEGAMLFDYDLDSDYDLAVAYTETPPGVRIWENRGDGTFFATEPEVVEDPFIGLDLGLSAEDWDMDGDIDFTTRQVFRKNLLVETGQRRFIVASHSIPPQHVSAATPAWGDWDKDGDLDCALGNFGATGHFYENILYGPATPSSERRHVRVRVVRDSDAVARGLETEYGASVEIRLRDDGASPSIRRRKFTSSAGGYLNQNEYTLHFALPPKALSVAGPDVRFDVVVDFPGLPAQGRWRVDRFVNPVLGNLDLGQLTDREITVYRSGKVVLQGCTIEPAPAPDPRLETTTGGLALVSGSTPLPDPTPTPTTSYFVGLDLTTAPASRRVRVKEMLLDAQLDSAVSCGAGEDFNVALWDVTVPASPVRERRLSLSTSDRNRRSHLPIDLVLEPGRQYRLVARVTELRPSPISAPVQSGPVIVLGGLGFEDQDPCSGAAVVQAAADPSSVSIALRLAEIEEPWVDLGHGTAGAGGVPQLVGSGDPVAGSVLTLALTGAPPHAPACLIVGSSVTCGEVRGATLRPLKDLVLAGLRTDASGGITLVAPWPQGLPPGATFFFQYWIVDGSVDSGVVVSNGVAVISRE